LRRASQHGSGQAQLGGEFVMFTEMVESANALIANLVTR
jgi:hypothetical protein